MNDESLFHEWLRQQHNEHHDPQTRQARQHRLDEQYFRSASARKSARPPAPARPQRPPAARQQQPVKVKPKSVAFCEWELSKLQADLDRLRKASYTADILRAWERPDWRDFLLELRKSVLYSTGTSSFWRASLFGSLVSLCAQDMNPDEALLKLIKELTKILDEGSAMLATFNNINADLRSRLDWLRQRIQECENRLSPAARSATRP